MNALCVAHGHADSVAIVTRMLLDRYYVKSWTEASHVPQATDPKAPGWQLYFALVKEMQARCQKAGAGLAILSDCEVGHYRWEVSWGLTEDSPASQAAHLSPTATIATFAAENGIGMVENHTLVPRYDNDPHPNVAGNQAMAQNIFDYLQTHWATELAACRAPAAEADGQ